MTQPSPKRLSKPRPQCSDVSTRVWVITPTRLGGVETPRPMAKRLTASGADSAKVNPAAARLGVNGWSALENWPTSVIRRVSPYSP